MERTVVLIGIATFLCKETVASDFHSLSFFKGILTVQCAFWNYVIGEVFIWFSKLIFWVLLSTIVMKKILDKVKFSYETL